MADKDLSTTLDFKTYGDSLLRKTSDASIAKSKNGDFSNWREDLWRTRSSIRDMTDYRDSESIKLSSLFERKAQLIQNTMEKTESELSLSNYICLEEEELDKFLLLFICDIIHDHRS